MMALSSRHALILAVPENGVDKTLNLPVVQSDAEELARALRQSSYDVTIRGTISPQEVSRSMLGTAIRNACKKVSEGGALLIFFSGHGIHADGTITFSLGMLTCKSPSIRPYSASEKFRNGSIARRLGRSYSLLMHVAKDWSRGRRRVTFKSRVGQLKSIAIHECVNIRSCSHVKQVSIRIT